MREESGDVWITAARIDRGRAQRSRLIGAPAGGRYRWRLCCERGFLALSIVILLKKRKKNHMVAHAVLRQRVIDPESGAEPGPVIRSRASAGSAALSQSGCGCRFDG